MPKVARGHNKTLHSSKDKGSLRRQTEQGHTRQADQSQTKSCRSASREKGEKSMDTVTPLNGMTDRRPYVVSKIKTPETSAQVAEMDACNSNKCISSGVEDCNNHGCASCPGRTPTCPPAACTPRNQVMCCSSNPSFIKIMAKLMLFVLLLASVCYSLFRVASSWTRRHEILTLILLLLITRLICKKNWFLPNQYWRNLDPSCVKGPKQVDVNVPSRCPHGMVN